MVDGAVKVERRNGVAIVTFDRGGSLNALSQELVLSLTRIALEFQEDFETRAVVLTGAATSFSAGIDLKDPARWDLAAKPGNYQRSVAFRGQRLTKAWENMPQVTIAAIEGMAVGAGIALALACDWRVAARTSYLYVPEVKMGLNLGWQTIPRLVSLIGPARAKRVAILCEKLQPELALEWGLIDEVAEHGASVDKALEIANAVAAMPSAVAVSMIKESVNASANALLHAASHMDADQSVAIGHTPEAVAARDRFRSKRSN